MTPDKPTPSSAEKAAEESAARERESAERCCDDCLCNFKQYGKIQHIRGFLAGAAWQSSQGAEALKLLNWIGMNSGIAADGNHVDPIAAHRENCVKLDAAIAMLKEGTK